MSRTKATLIGFIDKNEELIAEYEDLFGIDVLSLPIETIEDMIREIAATMKAGFNTIAYNSFQLSINAEKDIISVLEDLRSSDNKLTPQNSIQQYFSEINDIYKKNNNDFDIEFCEENRKKIIEMNLKSVIAIAKCYQGLGIDFEDLISAGNEGLCKAFEKYNPKRAGLKENMLDAAQLLPEKITYVQMETFISEFIKYGNSIKRNFNKFFEKRKTYTKEYVFDWINKHIFNAKFNSVACKWIKAYIINEINNSSRVVKKPKIEIDRDRTITGTYQKEQIVNLDMPVFDNPNSRTVGESLQIEADDDYSNIDIEEYNISLKEILSQLMVGIRSRDRRIILKRFGIGVVRPMTPAEIAMQEDLSVARVSQVINLVLERMQENAKDQGISVNSIMSTLDN